MHKTCSLTALFLFLSILAHPQVAPKKVLTHSDFYLWKSIAGQAISNDGNWVSYEENYLKGNGWIHLHNLGKGTHDSVYRAQGGAFDASSAIWAYTLKPWEDTVRKMKLAKRKKEDLPKDTLVIRNLVTDSLIKIPNLKSYSMPKEGGSWIAILSDKPGKELKKKADSDTLGKKPVNDSTSKLPPKKENPKKKKGAFSETETYQLTLMNPILKQKQIFQDVTEASWSKNGLLLGFVTLKKDSVDSTAVHVFNTATLKAQKIFFANGLAKKTGLDNQGSRLSFLYTPDTAKVKRWSLQFWNEGFSAPLKIADTATTGMPGGWEVSENCILNFSDDGSKLYFGTAPKILPQSKDTLLDEEKVKLDLWNWQDGHLQSQQLKELDRDLKKWYQAVYRVKEKKVLQLGDSLVEQVSLQKKGNADYALGITDKAYQSVASWDDARYRDIYLLDLEKGTRKLLMKKFPDNADLSPEGKYLLYYNRNDSTWNTRNLVNEKAFILTKGIQPSFCDEENDVPASPNDYGIAGWLNNDASVLVYDRYDIWQLDPENRKAPVNLTNGRAQKTSSRYIKLDPEALSINPAEKQLIKLTQDISCRQGFAQLLLNPTPSFTILNMNNYEYSIPVKANKSNRLVWQRGTYSQYPDLWKSSQEIKDAIRLSNANPQQANYIWGVVEPVKWVSFDGSELHGLMFKPENFDPEKKYPMIVYYYEKTSHKLFSYISPTPSRSAVNFPLYNSNGYMVFVPDIVYKTGMPGNSAYEAIMSGTMEMLKKYPNIDEKRLGLQGHSWGGYQTAYMITRTGMFRAAMAGAAVSNMTSAYGGIRWGTGVVREFQYEHGQSRIGGTLWTNRDLYIENSPIFFADRITTPLLMMNNDNDGAVPWYQGIEFFTALRRLGKPAWMLTYNGEEHSLTKLPNRQDLSIRMMQFFDYYLKGSPMPLWMKEGIPATLKGKELRY